MALRPTIHKCTVTLADLDRQYYDTLQLTVARHPSETDERMMVRILAYCIHAEARLAFSRGLSVPDEPDIWLHSLDNQILLWIDVGEPSADRIKKASRIARQVAIYTFNTKSSIWWQQTKDKCGGIPVSVFRLDWQDVQHLAKSVQRTMNLAITISESAAYVACGDDAFELAWTPLS